MPVRTVLLTIALSLFTSLSLQLKVKLLKATVSLYVAPQLMPPTLNKNVNPQAPKAGLITYGSIGSLIISIALLSMGPHLRVSVACLIV